MNGTHTTFKLKHQFSKPFPLLTLVLASTPWIWLILFWSYVLRARLQLGHWPSYNNVDPKKLDWWIQHDLIALGLMSFLPGVVSAVVLAMVGRVVSRDFPFWAILATAIAGSAALLAVVKLDPGGFYEWYWD